MMHKLWRRVCVWCERFHVPAWVWKIKLVNVIMLMLMLLSAMNLALVVDVRQSSATREEFIEFSTRQDWLACLDRRAAKSRLKLFLETELDQPLDLPDDPTLNQIERAQAQRVVYELILEEIDEELLMSKCVMPQDGEKFGGDVPREIPKERGRG